jgi:hypothetical protein
VCQPCAWASRKRLNPAAVGPSSGVPRRQAIPESCHRRCCSEVAVLLHRIWVTQEPYTSR